MFKTEGINMVLDHTTLHHHKFIYEKNHFLKAIEACKYLKSKYQRYRACPGGECFKTILEVLKENPMLKEDTCNTHPTECYLGSTLSFFRERRSINSEHFKGRIPYCPFSK